MSTRSIPVNDIQIGDVVTTGSGNAIVRDVDVTTTPHRLRVAAGRTDDGTWVTPETEHASVWRETWAD
jgi:hypothetical protein